MKTFLLIAVVILWVAMRAHSSASKQQGASKGSAPFSPHGPQGDAWATGFDPFCDGSPVEDGRQSFADEQGKDDYFTYETVEEPAPAPKPVHRSKAATPKRVKETASAEELPSPLAAPFDLRQAVIYQTILTNKYLDEMRNDEN